MAAHVQTIQKTGKGWKALMALSVLAVLVGIVISAMGFFSDDAQLHDIGRWTWMCASPVVLYAKAGIWWNHG